MRGQLSTDAGERAALFARSIDCFRTLAMPFDEARTLAISGDDEAITEAKAIFRRIGAAAWADTTAGPWAGTSESHGGSASLAVRLAANELDVALAVVSGRTDREIATELQLSVRSVEHYLERVLRKLGIERRADIGAALFR